VQMVVVWVLQALRNSSANVNTQKSFPSRFRPMTWVRTFYKSNLAVPSIKRICRLVLRYSREYFQARLSTSISEGHKVNGSFISKRKERNLEIRADKSSLSIFD